MTKWRSLCEIEQEFIESGAIHDRKFKAYFRGSLREIRRDALIQAKSPLQKMRHAG